MAGIDPTPPPPYTAAQAVAAVLAWLLTILTTAGDTLARNASNALARVGFGPYALASGSNIDFSEAGVQTKTLASVPTFTASNYTWARSQGVDLILTNSATVTLPNWPGTTTFVGTWNSANGAVNRVRLLWTGGTTFTATMQVPDANPTTTLGDILYAAATGTPGTLARLAAGANGTILTIAAGIPAWATAADVVGTYILTILTSSGGFLYRTSGGALGQSLQGTSALGAYVIDWAAADRFTKTLAGGDTFTHSNTEAKIAIRLILTVNGQTVPSGIGTRRPGTGTWSAAWTTADLTICKDGAGGYEYYLTGE